MSQKNRQQVIDALTQCGGMSYQDFIDFLSSIPFLNEIAGGVFDSFISKFTGSWSQAEANKGKYDIDYYVSYNNRIYKSTINNNKSVPDSPNNLTWVMQSDKLQSSLGFKGKAVPSTNPGVPSSPEFWVGDTGVYPNFGNQTITGASGFLIFNAGTWSVANINIDLSAYTTKDFSDFGGRFLTVADANLAVTNTLVNGKNQRDGKRVYIGAGENYTVYWWKGGYDDTNLIPYLGEVARNSDMDVEKSISKSTVAVLKSKNKIDTSKLNPNRYYSSSSSNIKENSAQPTLGSTDFIPVTPGGSDIYSGAASQVTGAGYFDINKQSLGINTSLVAITGGFRLNHPNNPNIAFLVINYLNAVSTADLMLESGTVKTAYEPYHDPIYKTKKSSLDTDVVETAVFTPIKNKVEEVLVHGSNYADKSRIVGGTYYRNSDGGIGTASNFRSLPPVFLEQGQWTVSGVRSTTLGWLYSSNVISSATAILRLNAQQSGVYLTELTFTVPSSGAWLGLNIEEAGSTPTGNYDNTVMLAKGTNKVYQAFIGNGVSIERVIGEIPGITKNSEFNPVKIDVNAIVNLDYNKYSNFDGTSYVTLPKTYPLNAVGDYVEFTTRFTGSGFDGLGLLGLRGTSGAANKIGFRTATEFAIRGTTTSDPYAIWPIPSAATDFRTYRVEVVADGWQLSIDGVLVSTQPKLSGIALLNIGNAYIAGTVFYKGDFKFLRIHNSTDDLTITDFSAASGSVNVKNVFAKKASVTSAQLPKMLYSFNLTGGYKSAGIMYIYTSYGDGSNYYVRFDIEHALDPSIRADLWRVRGAYLYAYNSEQNVMTSAGIQLLFTSENESVINITGKSDHTGGFHGDEILTDIKFFVDSQPISLSASIPLTKCNEFKYVQDSNLLDTDNPTVRNIIKHQKSTRFIPAGYECENDMRMLSAENVDLLYGALFCVSLPVSEYFYSSSSGYIKPAQEDVIILDELYNQTLNYYSSINNLGAECSGGLTKVMKSGVDATLTFNNLLRLKVWPRATDTKMYLRPNSIGTVFNIGDLIRNKSKIQFFRK